ncbi:MAG TPA: hypothetical protein PK400_09950 [Phycisphaerales bacterium]|nr:hypothetical protein [Phycisphaerales bacterium]HRQ75367.1 hypothetical protein [Phycisphaerales bacterium]
MTRQLASSRCSRKAPRRSGMTLIETALATVIIGVGVLAIVAAQQAFHSQNAWSVHAATATRLGNEIREMTLNLPRHDPVTGTAYWGAEPHEATLADYNDLDDFDNLIFSAALGNGPVNARREIIPNMTGWAQIVYVDKVDPFNINSAPSNPEHYLMRIEVVVTYQGPADEEPSEVLSVSWIAPN